MTLDEYFATKPYGEASRLAEAVGCSRGRMSNYRKRKAYPNPQRALRIVETTGGLVTLDDLRPLHKDEDCSDFELVARSIMRRLGYSMRQFSMGLKLPAHFFPQAFMVVKRTASVRPASMRLLYRELAKSGATPEEQRAMLIAYLKLTGDLFFVEKMAPSAMRDIYAFISRRLETERGVFVQHEPDERFKSKYGRNK